jgi:hypothetical protein
MPPGSSPGGSGADRPRAATAVRAGLLTSGRIIPTGRHCRRENRGQVLVENLMRVGGARESPACPRLLRSLERRPIDLPEVGRGKAQDGRVREAGPRSARGPLWRGENAHESIGSSGPRPVMCTDLRGEQSPEAAGHRQLLVLRAGARDARNGKRARAPKGARLRGGETLCRVNPMSGTGLRDRARGGE